MRALKFILFALVTIPVPAFPQADTLGEPDISEAEMLLKELEAKEAASGRSGDQDLLRFYEADSAGIAKFDTSYFLPGDPELNLIRAAEFGQEEVVRMLVDRGLDVDASTVEGVTPLMYASQSGDLEIMKCLIGKGADVNASPQNKVTPLIGATRSGHYEAVKLLLDSGARVDARDELDLTALMHASAYNYPDIAALLIERGADTEKGDWFKTKPLMMAAYYNCLEAADVLLDLGADPDGKDINGFTPLMIAVQHGDYDLAWMLLDRGANPGLQNAGGLHALAMAVMYGDEDLVELLLESGADINQNINSSTNPLSLARESGDEAMEAFLLENGARPNRSPEISEIRGGLELNFNLDDFMLGFQAGVSEHKYKTYLSTGFMGRLAPVRVLRTENDSVSWQYWEKRYLWPVSLGKDFVFLRRGSEAFGCRIHLTGALSWGSYRGAVLNPDTRILLIPGGGLTWRREFFGISFDYQYAPFRVHDISSHRFRLVFDGFFDFRSRIRYTKKDISWF